MEVVDLKWEQNEMEVEEEEVGGLQVRSSKAMKEVTNGKIETIGHANSTSKITNGTEKSDLGDEQERSEVEQLSDSNNGVEVEDGAEPENESVQQILVSNNGVEVETEKSDLDDEQERSEVEQLSDSNNGVEIAEVTEPEDESGQQMVVSNNGVEVGTEKSDLDEELERSEEHLSNSSNGVEVKEGTGKSDLDDEQERSEEHLSNSNNGVEVKEGTEKSEFDDELERSEEHLSDFNNGVDIREGTEPKEESVQQIVLSNNGAEERTEPQEDPVQKIVASNNGVEESAKQIVATDNGVEEVTEPKEETVDLILSSNNGVGEGTEHKEETVHQIAASNNGFQVEEETEAEEESVQQIVVSNNGVEKGTEESKHHLVTYTNGVEEGTEAEEGSYRSGHSVHYDKDEGIWKCRACSWTLQGKGLNIGWTNIPRGHLDKLMHYPMLDQRGLLFSFGSKDSNFISKPSIKEKINKIPGDEVVQDSATLDIQLNGYLRSDNLSSSSVQLSKDLSEDDSIVHKSTAIHEIESADADLIVDSDTDVKDFDVENVLQKQNTHDLYCPNCKSCITKRVILRKRKRKIRVSADDFKRNKLEVVVDSKVDASHAQAADDEVRDRADSLVDGTPPLAVDDNQPDREPELFTCLSCFTFFIPTGNGFRLLRSSGEKGAEESVKGEQKPTTNKNWFSSIFALDKGKASVEQGIGIGANAVKNDPGVMPADNFKDQSAQSSVINEYVPPAYTSSEITQEAGGKISGSKNQDANMKGKMVIDTVGKSETATRTREGGSLLDIFEEDTRLQPGASASSKKFQENDRNDELLRNTGRNQINNDNLVQESLLASNDRKDELLRPGGRTQDSNGNLLQESLPAAQQNEQKLLITSTKEESLTIEKSKTDLKSDMAILNKDPDNESLLFSATTAFALNGLGKPNFYTEIPQKHVQHTETMLPSESPVANNDNKFQLSSEDGVHHYEVSQHTITKTNIEIHSKQPLNVDEHALILSVKDALSIQDKPDNITNIPVEGAASDIAGNDTIITMEAGHETRETALANPDTQIHSVEGQEAADRAEGYKIEIIKSIIFGGLAESITSLSVVSSATGGDTSTLNILVLAMANLIGGLFIIFQNLWELKRDRYEQASNQRMEKHVDRYREQLGRRENFTVHAVFVVLSYIIFGLVPPVTYGFSFRKSEDKELKIVSVAAASLVCILMLAIGKAYVQRAPKPYFKTISTYIILGFTVSGVSYAAGILFNRLLEKLGLFEPSSTVNLFLPEMPRTGSAWASL